MDGDEYKKLNGQERNNPCHRYPRTLTQVMRKAIWGQNAVVGTTNLPGTRAGTRQGGYVLALVRVAAVCGGTW